jgi:preprotein translocase SecE subunit
MAEKKKNAGQSTLRNQNQVRGQAGASTKTQSSEKEQPVKSIGAMARDEQTVANKSTKVTERKEPAKQDNKPRSSSKGPSSLETRFRSSRIGRFVLEAYYELRHKVTWPTFEEARNMTIVVIGLSAVIGTILGLADLGLTQLFLLISGRGK